MSKRIFSFLMAVVACSGPAVLWAQNVQIDKGQADTTPWSGYWWPHRDGRILHSLHKYDQLTGSSAADWERKRHPAGDTVPSWHGYCHASAASAMLEVEPRVSVDRTSPLIAGEQVNVSVGDQKAWLALCHTQDVANVYGDRFGDDEQDDRQDLAPDVLWRLLKLYLRQRKVPLVIDVEAGTEVWNYPVYQYEVRYHAAGEPNEYRAEMVLLMADNAVHPDYVGTRSRRQTYSFSFRMQEGTIELGSGRWIGPSSQNHPDFAWYPFVAVAENPEVKLQAVRSLLSVATPRSENVGMHTPGPSTPGPDVPLPGAPALPSSSEPAPVTLSPVELTAALLQLNAKFGLDVNVDRFDGGNYAAAEPVQVSVISQSAGYVQLFHIDPQGRARWLTHEKIQIRAGETFQWPPKGETFSLPGPAGVHRVKAIVSKQPFMASGFDKGVQRIAPSEWRWMKATLAHAAEDQHVNLASFSRPREVLGDFSLDEVAFYVRPESTGRAK